FHSTNVPEFINHQTPGTVARFLGRSSNVLVSSTAPSHTTSIDWGPVWYIDVCCPRPPPRSSDRRVGQVRSLPHADEDVQQTGGVRVAGLFQGVGVRQGDPPAVLVTAAAPRTATPPACCYPRLVCASGIRRV